MKLTQQDTTFSPVTIVLETREEAGHIWDIVLQYANAGGAESEEAYQMAVAISNWFSNKVKL